MLDILLLIYTKTLHNTKSNDYFKISLLFTKKVIFALNLLINNIIVALS